MGTMKAAIPDRMLSNSAAYVVDCGLGVIDQYGHTGIPFPALRSIFITHHHPDHIIEYGPLLVESWIMGMHLDVRAFGPPPLKKMPRISCVPTRPRSISGRRISR
jgi:ribonuclease BN (tRNA processing enzyme)